MKFTFQSKPWKCITGSRGRYVIELVRDLNRFTHTHTHTQQPYRLLFQSVAAQTMFYSIELYTLLKIVSRAQVICRLIVQLRRASSVSKFSDSSDQNGLPLSFSHPRSSSSSSTTTTSSLRYSHNRLVKSWISRIFVIHYITMTHGTAIYKVPTLRYQNTMRLGNWRSINRTYRVSSYSPDSLFLGFLFTIYTKSKSSTDFSWWNIVHRP